MKKTFLFLLLACSFFANGQSGVNKKLIHFMMTGGGSPVNPYDKVNSARTRNNGVFIFNYSNSGNKLFRIFTPFNDRYAQFWTLTKEVSANIQSRSVGKLGFFNTTAIVQPTTGITAATFTANTSLIANDTATFDGYTIG